MFPSVCMVFNVPTLLRFICVHMVRQLQYVNSLKCKGACTVYKHDEESHQRYPLSLSGSCLLWQSATKFSHGACQSMYTVKALRIDSWKPFGTCLNRVELSCSCPDFEIHVINVIFPIYKMY